MKRRYFTQLAVFIGLTLPLNARANWWSKSNENTESGNEALKIGWDDLIPDGFTQPESPFNDMSQEEIDILMDGSEESQAEMTRLQTAYNYAPVVSELDGKRIQIPAYVTPLEFNEDSMLKEFLLVPYVGACIHVPPPPANQIVHAQSEEAIKFENTYDPIWAIGVLRTETIKSELAESGYRLEVEKVMPYTQP